MRFRALNTLALVAVLVAALGTPVAGHAQTGLTVEASATAVCETGTFTVNVSGGSGTYDLAWAFGDGETLAEPAVAAYPHSIDHVYPGSGQYEWTVTATDTASAEVGGSSGGALLLGPSVTLATDVFPPVLTLEGGQATLNFTATPTGGTPPYTYAWDLDGDGQIDPGSDPSSPTASFTYTGAGKFQATVTVTDGCGLSDSATLVIVVFDPEAACHPMAQRIAEAVDSLFPGQAGQLYSCEDIFGMFNGDLTGSQLGFGRMWHAYQLATSIEELTWEEILAWQLGGTGWGLLAQLDRFAEALDTVDTRQLYEMVMTGGASVGDIRTAFQAATRFGADFDDALARVAAGDNPGEVFRFYRMTADTGLDPATLDAYLAGGAQLSDIQHSEQLASRFGADLDAILTARAAGHSWGEINQAYRLADDENSAEDILAIGPQVFSQQQRGQEQHGQGGASQDTRMAERLAERYGLSVAEIQAMLDACGGDWGCVRQELRQGSTGAVAAQDDAMAQRLAAQYGVGVDQVWSIFNGACAGDWNCVRKTLQGDSHPGGNPHKP